MKSGTEGPLCSVALEWMSKLPFNRAGYNIDWNQIARESVLRG